MEDYYCDICDKTVKNKSKTNHHRSKNHLHMKSYVKDEHIVGNVYWKDFYRVICDYVDNNRKKFPIFKTLVKCNLFNKDLTIYCDNIEKKWIRFGFGDKIFNDLNPVCEEIPHRIHRYAMISNQKLSLDTVLENVSITFFSYYYIMTPRHRLEQSRRVLESRLLKHITNLNDDVEKKIKYRFLWQYFKPRSCDNNMHIHIPRIVNRG